MKSFQNLRFYKDSKNKYPLQNFYLKNMIYNKDKCNIHLIGTRECINSDKINNYILPVSYLGIIDSKILVIIMNNWLKHNSVIFGWINEFNKVIFNYLN